MNTSKLKTEHLILIIIMMMALINGLMSCTSTKVVYQKGSEWKPMDTRSTVTGWAYK